MNSMTEKYEQVRLLKKDLKTLQLVIGLLITDIKTGEKLFARDSILQQSHD